MNPDAQERPIRVLREQERETSPDFMNRIRGRIYRRTAASQVASYSWHLPKTILLELARLLSHIFRAFGTPKDS
jgi:hypothetical protein